MKILMALDPSAPSARAVDFVRRMRWPAGSRVIVMSILPSATPLGMGYEPALPQEVFDAQRHVADDLVRDASLLLADAGIPTETRVLAGDARQTLLDAAAAEHADLIIVGSHGRTGVSKLLLGSVSSHIVTHAPCSVLVVKQERRRPRAAARPIRARAHRRAPTRR